ncbi:hypothetical protein SDRG_15304 [Saprolegnia diclina VS20]|uniref:Ion transport domain-containing protein n=1 Tax=Saprolegnia diclina (strain VS20) TaxID=1156394 RepID=T0PXA7_SAPDV|nr:hypothetical protein SDRG_15304 [Saprolegnia diclina VS20]EQC26881.1 hypothetical protein SDRG_15304 [Saprolegnia diclina VS20]|eukprot:XP_008619694.1 hypothetical protein SDRG_15304 [Saprolegnia diclina VS20]
MVYHLQETPTYARNTMVEEANNDSTDSVNATTSAAPEHHLKALARAIEPTRVSEGTPKSVYAGRIKSLAQAEKLLDECLEKDPAKRVENTKKVEDIYLYMYTPGRETGFSERKESLRKTPLYLLLHADRYDQPTTQPEHHPELNQATTTDVVLGAFEKNDIKARKKHLLDHPVMRVVITLKWRAFGLRMYCEQRLMFWLLLVTMTISVSIGLGVLPEATYDDLFMGWLTTCSLLLIGVVATRFLTWKNKKPWACTLAVTLACVGGGLQYVYEPLQAQLSWTSFGRLNNIVLSLCAIYFCVFEIRELAADIDDPGSVKAAKRRSNGQLTESHTRTSANQSAGRANGLELEENRPMSHCEAPESPWTWAMLHHYCIHAPIHGIKCAIDLLRGKSTSPYLESYWNRIQFPTFFAVFACAVGELTLPLTDDVRTFASIPALFLLYIMGLQNLEVFGNISYLLPMMRRMLTDVVSFLVFFWSIQCGYTCAYYLLFKSKGNDPVFAPYATVPQCFVTTYLVTFAQINLEPFKALTSPVQWILGYVLLLTHATISIVMLLNVLIAMMNKTMGSYLEEAKHEARVTFAECVLRLEKTKTFATTEADLKAVIVKGDSSNDTVNEKIETLLERMCRSRRVTTRNLDVLQARVGDVFYILQAQNDGLFHVI